MGTGTDRLPPDVRALDLELAHRRRAELLRRGLQLRLLDAGSGRGLELGEDAAVGARHGLLDEAVHLEHARVLRAGTELAADAGQPRGVEQAAEVWRRDTISLTAARGGSSDQLM